MKNDIEMIKNSTLLITGGTGSFGSTFLRKISNYDLKEIRIFSRDEKKQDDLRKEINSDKVNFYIGDVRDYSTIENAMYGVDYVFHAAALKQVPSCEFFPMESVKTNIIGTQNVIRCAIKNNVKKIICLSTDKACYPINAMGMSKAIMEKVALAEARNSKKTKICITRYGNVMASRGSVIPLFINQILNNQDLTVTVPEMTRFLMSLNEAVNLVLFALSNGQNGDLFVQKSPASNVIDLASALKKMFKSKSQVQVIGPRHGEKLHETLLTSEEFNKSIDLGNYFKVSSDKRSLNYSKVNRFENLSMEEEYNSFNTNQLSIDEIISKLRTLDYVEEIKNLK